MTKGKISLRQWCDENGFESIYEHMLHPSLANNIGYMSHSSIDFVCDKGHSFFITLYIMTRQRKGFKCPICSGQRVVKGINDLATTHPYIINEWDYEENDKCGLTPYNVSAGSHEDAWWVCEDGHEWRARISSRALDGRGCPYCSNSNRTSIREQCVGYYLKKHLQTDIYNNYSLDGIEYDIYIPALNVAIEYDGIYWHSDKDTSHKDEYCKANGITYYKVIESNVTKREGNYFYYYFTGNIMGDICFKQTIVNLIQELGYNGTIKIDLQEDYSNYIQYFKTKKRTLEKSTVAGEVIEKYSDYWDEARNKYKIEYVKNDGYPKWWKCKNGHSFQRRLDVILRGTGLKCKLCDLGDRKAIIYCMRFYISFIFTNLRQWIPHHGYRAYVGLIDEGIVMYHTEENCNIQRNLNNITIHSFCGETNRIVSNVNDILKVQVYSSWMDLGKLTESTEFLLSVLFDNTPYKLTLSKLNFNVDVERDLDRISKGVAL